MTDPNELARTLEAVAAAFDAANVTWAIGGSVASAAYGEPRATNDIDVVARLDESQARSFARSLGAAFYADADMAVEAARTHRSFNVIDTRGFIKVDVFVPPPGPLGAGQLDRRRLLEIASDTPALPVLGPEDVVLQKLRWYRLTGETSERQWRDVISVLRGMRGDLDTQYLDAVDIGDLRPLLERARDEAGRADRA